LSSLDNPQFEPQPLGGEPQAPVPQGPFPPAAVLPPPPAPRAGENPVWSGWDVLLTAGFTLLITLFVVPLLVVLGARHFVYPHQSWVDVAQKPALVLLCYLLSYIVV